MKKSTYILQAIAAALLFIVAPMNAAHLDGLWRSDRQNITLRIEQSDNGFRAKRMDQGIWYNYILIDNNVYADRNGNWYEVIDDRELMWYESNSSKRMYFTKISDRDDDEYDNDNWDRWNENDRDLNSPTQLDGRWYDRRNSEYLIIKTVRDGYMVQMPNGASRKFTSDRSEYKFKDGNGNTLQVLDRNSIRMRIHHGKQERSYIRQTTNSRHNDNNRGNSGTQHGNSGKAKHDHHEHSKTKHDNHGHSKKKHDNHGHSKKSCG